MRCPKGHVNDDCTCGFDNMIREADHSLFWGLLIPAVIASVMIGALFYLGVIR